MKPIASTPVWFWVSSLEQCGLHQLQGPCTCVIYTTALPVCYMPATRLPQLVCKFTQVQQALSINRFGCKHQFAMDHSTCQMPTWVVRLADDYCDGYYKNAHDWLQALAAWQSQLQISMAPFTCMQAYTATHAS